MVGLDAKAPRRVKGLERLTLSRRGALAGEQSKGSGSAAIAAAKAAISSSVIGSGLMTS